MKAPRVITGPFYSSRHAIVPVQAKLPELFRSVQITREQINQEDRTVPVIFATDAPCDRWFGRERLVCEPGACNIQRAAQFGAFLSEHDREKQIGVIVPGSIIMGQGRALATLRFSKNSPTAEQEWKDLLDGIRGLFSVGYVVHKLVLVEEDDTAGNLYNATDWELLEISMVAIPADINCTLAKSENELTRPCLVTVSPERAETQPEQEQSDMLRRSYFSRFFKNDDGGGTGSGGTGGGTPAPTAPVPSGEAGRGQSSGSPTVEDERERCRELASIGLRFGCTDVMETFIRGGQTVEQAYKHVAENGLRSGGKPGGKKPKALLTAGDAGERGERGESESEGGEGEGGDGTRSLGESLISSESFRDLFNQDQKGASNRKMGILHRSASMRATLVSSAVPAGWAVDRQPGIVTINQQRLTIADLMLPGSTTSSSIEYMQEAAYANAAAMTAEGATKPEATFTLTSVTAAVRKCAVTAKISDEMISDYPYVQSYVDGRMRFMVQEKEEAQLLSGDGVAPNVLGLLNQPTIQTQALGGDTISDAIHKAMTKVRVNAKAEPNGAVMHPTDWEYIALSKDANGQYLAGGPFFLPYGNGEFVQAQRIWGVPVVQTTAITAGTALVGSFTEAQIFRRTGISAEVSNSNEDDFKKNLIAIRVEERFALCVYRPNAFCTVTGIVAPA